MVENKRLIPPSKFRDGSLYNGSFSESCIRWLIFNAEKNGFSRCLRRLGRKILIDLDQFELWIDQQGAKK